MSNSDRMLYGILICLIVYLIALGIGYIWARAMHYPFTRRQRMMWTYYAMWMTAIPVLGPLMLAMGLWLLPVRASIETTIFLLFIWMVVAFRVVRRMSRPGGRLSQERQESD